MSSPAAHLCLLLAWTALHRDALRWLVAGWSRDEGQLHLLLALVAGGWIVARSPRPRLDRPLRADPWALALTFAPALASRLGPDLNSAHAVLALASGYGLFGLFVDRARWRAALGPAALLLAVLPLTGHLDVLLGYPLRRAIAAGVAACLGGVDSGTVLEVDGRRAHVDLPCSGIRGLWSACVVLLGAAVAWGRHLGVGVGAALGVGVLLQVAQNVARVGALVVANGVDPLLADVVHLPLGMVGFALALVGPLALVAGAPRAPAPAAPSHRPRTAVALWALVALALVGAVPRPSPERVPAPAVAAPEGWAPLPALPQETAFLEAHGAQLAKARHPSGVQVAMVSSRSWLAHHVPEQCLTAHGWVLQDDHPALVGAHTVRLARATRGREQATALWWFRSRDTSTDDHTVRARAGLVDDTPWVLVSVLVPPTVDGASLDALVLDLDAAALTSLEPR